MKKIITFTFVAITAVSIACAQSVFGFKGTFGMNFGSKFTDEFSNSFIAYLEDLTGEKISATDALMLNGGGSVYCRYNMPSAPSLGVQWEVGFTVNNGAGKEVIIQGQKLTTEYSYLSIDMPLLLTFNIPASSLMITPMIGINFSVPSGTPKIKEEFAGQKANTKMDGFKVTGFIPGFIAGIEASIPVSSGAITVGASYINDFTPVKVEQEGYRGTLDLILRRNFNVSFGYATKV